MRALRLALAALAAIGLVATSACSSSSGDDKKVSGIVLATCTGNQRLIQVVDPENGKVLDTKLFVLRDNQRTLLQCRAKSGVALFSALSPDLSKLAVAQPYGESGWHVGTLEATDSPKKPSKFEDLSGDTENLGTPVVQTTGAFGPDGKFYTVEHGSGGTDVRVIDVASGESELVKADLTWKELDESGDLITVDLANQPAPGAESDSESDDDPTTVPLNRVSPYFLPRNDMLQVDPYPYTVYSPDGDWGFTMPNDQELAYGDLQHKGDGKVYPLEMPPNPKYKQGGADGSTYSQIEPKVYVDKKHVFASDGSDMFSLEFLREQVVAKVVPMDVIKDGDAIIDPTPRPDDKAFAFVRQLEDGKGQRTLYVATIDGERVSLKKLDTSLAAGGDHEMAVLSWS